MLAVDIGATRIKAAYRTLAAHEPVMVTFDGLPWLASHAHLPRNHGTIVFGLMAEHLSDEDPGGAIEGDVLSEVAAKGCARVAGRTIGASELLGALLRYVREQAAASLTAPGSTALEDLVLTIPFGNDGAADKAFRAAAFEAGFDAARIAFEPEAATAALGGLPMGIDTAENIVVLDFGGRSTRCAWVRRTKAGYVLDPAVRPELLNNAGMSIADFEVLDQLLEDNNCTARMNPRDRSAIFQQITREREALGITDHPITLRTGDRVLTLESNLIRRSIRSNVLMPVLSSLERFLNTVRLHTHDDLMILLTGGASGTSGLRGAIEELGTRVVVSPYGEHTNVRGATFSAIPTATYPPTPKRSAVTGGNRSKAQGM